MNRRPRHWLNPHYRRSETEASSCRLDCRSHRSSWNFSSTSLKTENRMKKVESRVRSILTCLPKSWAKLNTLTNSLTSILTSLSEPKDEKEVVMEGVLPTTKASLLTFLKGMGLRPKVELVGEETIISADMSVIHDEALKRKFLDVIKMQVIESAAPTNASSSFTTEPSGSSMPESSQNDKKNHHNSGQKTQKTADSHNTGPFKLHKPGHHLPPGPLNANNVEESHCKREGMPRTSIDSLPPGPFKPDKPNGTLPPGPYRTENQMRQESAMPRRTSKPGELPPGPFLPAHPGEPLPHGPFKPRTSGADDLPPVPWGPKKKTHDDEQKSVGSQSSHEEHNGPRKNVSFAWHQKQYTTPEVDCWHHQPSNQGPANGYDERKNENSGQKPKKLRVLKHLRRWIRGSKKVALPYQSNIKVEENREDSKALRRTPSKKSRNESGPIHDCSPRNSDLTPQICQEANFNSTTVKGKQTVQVALAMKPLEAYDGSISMPVLITPDRSCFKTKRPRKGEFSKASKSGTRAREVLEEEPTTYSVVGNSAAIHIAKNRIRLEGEDTKYGSILHKDKNFDDHFKVLQQNSMEDIEHQVNKVKERIMFARAIDSVGRNMSEGAPMEVNLKSLLWPEEKDKRNSTKKNRVDIVTKSSFYQKFLTSMNILKCTNRTDACDRSVMTDEPLSRTYAEFISATTEMSYKNCDSKKWYESTKKRPINCERSSASIGDSSCDQPSKSYMTKICQCWETLLPSKREQIKQPSSRFDPLRTDDEKILKCVVNKVIDSSRNKKKGYIKTDIKL